VAEVAAERMEELAGKASLRDAGTTAGIATDKLLALLGESSGVPVNVNLQVNAQLLHQRYQELIAALPNGETLSDPPAAMELQSGKENLQKWPCLARHSAFRALDE
jgi:hypothetical protein